MPTRGHRKRPRSSSPKNTEGTSRRTSKRLDQKKTQASTTQAPASPQSNSDNEEEDEFKDDDHENETSDSDTHSDTSARKIPKAKPKTTRQSQSQIPTKPSQFEKPYNTSTNDPHRITLQNYEECDLDESALDELLAKKDRKTSNRIPPDIQTELKNIQMWYRRTKKMFALIAHCSEKTVNEFLCVRFHIV